MSVGDEPAVAGCEFELNGKADPVPAFAIHSCSPTHTCKVVLRKTWSVALEGIGLGGIYLSKRRHVALGRFASENLKLG